MTTIEESAEEEKEGGDIIKNTDLISLTHF